MSSIRCSRWWTACPAASTTRARSARRVWWDFNPFHASCALMRPPDNPLCAQVGGAAAELAFHLEPFCAIWSVSGVPVSSSFPAQPGVAGARLCACNVETMHD